jgi:hypothetical protein
MKIFRVSIVAVLLYVSFSASLIGFSSCKKDVVYDTTVIHHTDTLLVADSVYNITDGLVAYYNFNGGNLNDSSGYGNNIVFSNATPTADRFGHPNNAYLFDGASNYMFANDASSLNPNNTITLMAIIKVNGFYTGACNVNAILGKGLEVPNGGEYYLRFSDYITNSCSISPTVTQETFSAAYASQIGVGSVDTPFVKPNTWYNLIFTYDGFQGRYYINGQLKKTWNGITNLTANTFNLFIGAYEQLDSHPYWFNGVIDEIRIYNRDLPYGAVVELNNLKE